MAPSDKAKSGALTSEAQKSKNPYLQKVILEMFKENRIVKARHTGEPHAKRDYRSVLDEVENMPPPLQHHVRPEAGNLITVEDPYPPCIHGLVDLEPALLSELTMNTHHRGQVLLAKLVGIYHTTERNACAAIEDMSGDVEFLRINFVCMIEKAGYAWPDLGSWLAIKEPFLTVEEIRCAPCIRIDHPSDLIFAGSWPLDFIKQSGLPETSIDGERVEQGNALGYKEAGNLALAVGGFDAAHVSYTEGIRLIAGSLWPSDQTIKQDLYRNRSHVRLALGYHEGAVEDAIASLTHIPDEKHKRLDAKAYFRAASAFYSLQMYQKAALLLCDQLALVPKDKDAPKMLERIQARLREQSHGSYDVTKIRESVSLKPRVDVADFLINTTVKTSGPTRGRGLFATRDLEPGDLIMAETAFCCTMSHEDNSLVDSSTSRSPDKIHSGIADLWRATVNEVAKNPSKGYDLLTLHGDYKGTGAHVIQVDDIAVVDTFRVYDIVACNAFSLEAKSLTSRNDPTDEDKESFGIFIRLSYINHSCIPNSQRVFHGNLGLLYATRPIAEGEEITLNYLAGEYQDFEARTNAIKISWGFQCQCGLCKADANCSSIIHTERSVLWEKTADLEAFSPLDRASLNKMEQYMVMIDRTYDAKLYAGIPRGALLLAQSRLLSFHFKSRDRSKASKATANLLRMLGYQVDTDGETILKISHTKHSILPERGLDLHLLGPLVGQAVEAHTSGATTVAKQLLDFAKLSEVVSYGTVNVMADLFKETVSRLVGR